MWAGLGLDGGVLLQSPSRAGAVVGRAKRGMLYISQMALLNHQESAHQTSGLLSLKDNL